MEVENNPERVIERPGKENINVKLADNTGKKPQTAKRAIRPRRKVRRFRNALGRKNYTGKRNLPPRRRQSQFSGDARKRQRGLRPRRRGVKIIIRNLTRNTTNADIKSVFEKIGPLRRCGINWNNLGESKGTAIVEYYYRRDAFRAARKLDFKTIKGVPIRLEMREGLKRIFFNRLGDRSMRRTRSTGARRFRSRSNYNRSSGGSSRRNRSFSQRNSARRGLRNRSGRRDGSRNDRRYKKY
jgi:RNA recognition motif-containing protein